LKRVEVVPVPGIPEIKRGANLPLTVVKALRAAGISLEDRDVVVVKQKVVSKAEGRLVALSGVKPSRRAKELANEQGKDPRLVELVLKESVRVVRAGHGVIITETKHGFVCANSGVDQSNVPEGWVALLPADPDLSAEGILRGLESRSGKELAVVISDTFGRPWRRGQTDVAIGCAGIVPLVSYMGLKDKFGYELRVTEPAVVDEIAGAAELAVGKLKGVPVAVVRGVEFTPGGTGVRSMIMERQRDLFR
jgi:coenzyme F420-0:L-glutamate ligase/coenzyme F420-1:gamma-L-glutamate ligase